MSCDDTCVLDMSVSTGPRDPANKERILTRTSYTSWRNVNLLDKSETEENKNFGKEFSEFYTLQKDEYYYFQTSIKNTGGFGHHTIGMEVVPDQMPAFHPKMDTVIQVIAFGQSGLKWDTMQIRVQQVD